MSDKQVKIIKIATLGVVLVILLVLISSLILRQWIAALSSVVLIFIVGYFGGRLISVPCLESSIIKLLKANNGRIEQGKILEYFHHNSSSFQKTSDADDTVLSLLVGLKRKGIIRIDNDIVYLVRS